MGTPCWPGTDLGRSERVLIAGHLDTVPVADNLPSSVTTGPDGIVVTAAARPT